MARELGQARGQDGLVFVEERMLAKSASRSRRRCAKPTRPHMTSPGHNRQVARATAAEADASAVAGNPFQVEVQWPRNEATEISQRLKDALLSAGAVFVSSTPVLASDYSVVFPRASPADALVYEYLAGYNQWAAVLSERLGLRRPPLPSDWAARPRRSPHA